MRYFCTLFNQTYLLKGLALYRSLLRHCEKFRLYILCMDDETYSLLEELQYEFITLIHLNDFEDEELKRAKSDRTVGEYCWTCTPSLPLYIFNRYKKVDAISYLDADLLFFSSPEPIFDELGDNSILIIEHRFAPRFRYLEVNGIYNVEMLCFKRDRRSMEVLHWWRERCIEWCYNRLEDGKIGDQKYLDVWPQRFEGVHVLNNVGAGVAPWNVEKYVIRQHGGGIYVNQTPLIFYHFHDFTICKGNRFHWMSHIYRSRTSGVHLIYNVYEQELIELRKQLKGKVAEKLLGEKSYFPIAIRNIVRSIFPASVKNILKNILPKRMNLGR